MRRRFVVDKSDPIGILKQVYSKHVPDEKDLDEEGIIKSFIAKVGQ